ncbi:MAG: hypothetical protein ACRDZ6_02420 [Acidimicrobiales bacterium]
MSHHRANVRAARARSDEAGSALILVLIIAVLILAALGIAISTSISGLHESSSYKSNSQGEMAAQSGLATEVNSLRAITDYSNFPCQLSGSLGVDGSQSSYKVAVSYSANGVTLPCTGTTLGGSTVPDHATLTSIGKAPHAASTAMAEDVAIHASAGTSQSPAIGYAIFTESDLDLTNAAVINQSSTNIPDIYAGQLLTCDNGTTSEGSVTSLDPITLSNACSFAGDVGSAGTVTLQNSATIGGNVTSCSGSSSSGLTMTGNSLVKGNATAISGAISLSNSGTIDGNAEASLSISTSGGSEIKGTSSPGTGGLTCPSSITTPIAFPVYDPSIASWVSGGWNVIQVPGPGYPACGDYFHSYSSGADDAFMTTISTATQKTVVYAPTCAVSYQNAHTFVFNTDIALVVQSLTLQNSNTFEANGCTTSGCSASPAPHHDFSVLASPGSTCSTSTIDVSLSNSTNFAVPTSAPSITAFFYSPGQIDYANAPSMLGQILACGGMVGENAFTLAFDPSAALGIPGVAATPPTVTLSTEDKYTKQGA